jgi:GH15 family glucan-1,4-alpha-glucosidase
VYHRSFLVSYPPIESYGIIGNLHTVALVGTNGSIDFLCLPRFDSPSVFAALLDHEKGGRFQIVPHLGHRKSIQLYLPDTNVLLTRFLSDNGVAEIADLMPVDEAGVGHMIVRRVRAVRGEIRFRVLCDPRFDYARAEREVEQRGREIVFRSRRGDGTALRLHTGVKLEVENGAAAGEFVLRAGEVADFVLRYAAPGDDAVSELAPFCARAFDETVEFWRRWVQHSQYRGRWSEVAVNRSALTLKLLTSRPHGSLVAAATFGLPESVGGERNWDYRYTWIRDSSFTLYALLRLGYTDEARAFMGWIEERCGDLNPDGSLQIVYGIDGRRELTEETLAHLEGYRGSSPVRIGNGAYDQLQLDIYGELMDSVYLYDKFGEPINYDLWENLARLVDWVCANWRRKDEGVWEVRGGPREFLYGRLMCWVAVDRAVRLAWKGSRDAPLDRWIRVRNEIYREIFEHFWDPQLKAFVQYKGSKALDAACLMMPLVRFIGPRDPRWLSTLAAVERELVDDTLVYRYRVGDSASDGLRGTEGTFNMCSFWYIECLSRAGQLRKARLNFDKMLGYANHLGLYSEELGPSGEHLGNYPQAFTQLGQISAAYDLNRRLDAAGHE